MKLKRLAYAGVGGVGASYVGAQAVGLLSRMGPPSAVTANAAMIGGPLLLGWFLGKRKSAMLKDVGTGMAVQGATTAGLLLVNRFAGGSGN